MALPFAGGCVAIIAAVSNEASKTVTVKYEVTGDTRNVTVTYTTWNDGNTATSRESVAQLPWTKEMKAKGFSRGGSLTVSLGAADGSVSCSVTVDDDAPKTARATGPFATATGRGCAREGPDQPDRTAVSGRKERRRLRCGGWACNGNQASSPR